MVRKHRWSGWPGAFCLDCGCEDPTEVAVAEGLFDMDPEQDLCEFNGTAEQYVEMQAKLICPRPQMKIHLLSDVHLEFAPYLRPFPQADVLVLAGDVCSAGSLGLKDKYAIQAFFQNAFETYDHILWVFGNHEYYRSELETAEQVLFDFVGSEFPEHRHKLVNLNCSTVIIDGIKFIGATLWTDYLRHDPLCMIDCTQSMADYRVIKMPGEDRRINAADLYHLHEKHKRFIVDELELAEDMKTFVVTHHAPSYQSIHPRYKGDLLNGGFCSDLEYIMLKYKPAFWVHGHVHDEFDYIVESTRVVCNPVGYPGEKHHNTSSVVLEITR